MAAKLIVLASLLSLGTNAQTPPKFMGREVTIIKPEMEDDFFPKGPASMCIEGPPQRQCYTAPKDFGRDPQVSLVQLDKATPALFFSAASGGVSGFAIHFALLRLGTEKDLSDLFPYITISNQSQHAFWNEPSISASPIFLTADIAPGSDQAHYGEHRYVVSAYTRTSPPYEDDIFLLEDQFMTIRKYDPFANADILASEKPEILARLRRVKPQPNHSIDRVLPSGCMDPRIRVLVAKPGLDGHDRGAKVIARALRDAGMEVIYTGLRQTPEMIVSAALQEDVQVIGLSILSGAHNAIVPRIMDLLREKGMDDVLVLVGGIIPDEDARELKKLGVAAVFQPGASLEAIVDFIRSSVKQTA